MFGKIFSVFNKIRTGFEEMKVDGDRAGQEQSSVRAKDEAKKFTSLGMTHGDYPQIYQDDLNEYIAVQSNLTSNDDYGKLKIINAVDTGNDRGYFQTGVPSCKIHWLEETFKGEEELAAILLAVEDFEAMYEVGGIMTILYPAIHALYTKSLFASRSEVDETIAKIAQFIGDKSVEQIQSLQRKADTLTAPITKVDRNEFTTCVPTWRIFETELKTHYDVDADEVQMSFSILIVDIGFTMLKINEETRKKFVATREKLLGID